MDRIGENSQIIQAKKTLEKRIGSRSWAQLHEWTQSALVTSEFLNITLTEVYDARQQIESDQVVPSTGNAPLIDFSPIILSLFKAVEIEIAEGVFKPFRRYFLISKKQKKICIPDTASPEEKAINQYLLSNKETLPRLGLEGLERLLSQLLIIDNAEERIFPCLKKWIKMNFINPEFWFGKGNFITLFSTEIQERNKAAHTWRFSPFEAVNVYNKLWGDSTSSGRLSVFFKAIEKYPFQGQRIEKYEIEKQVLVKPKYWLMQAKHQHMGHSYLLTFVQGDFRKLQAYNSLFETIASITHNNLLLLKEWFPAPSPYSGIIILASSTKSNNYLYSPLKKKAIAQFLPEDQCKRLLFSLASAVGRFHDNDLVHGFISPKNVFCDEHGTWLLGGQALTLLAQAKCSVYLYPRVIAPELKGAETYIDISKVTQQSDVFAIAATICCLRKGTSQRNCAPPKPDDVDSIFSDNELKTILKKALSPNKDERQRNANELITACENQIPINVSQKLESQAVIKGTGKNGVTVTKKVFISYNHKDKSIAERLSSKLRGKGIETFLDVESMRPGDDISKFITDSIKACDIMLSVVSKNSLFSAWVVMEALGIFSKQDLDSKIKFIPCNIDEKFFDRNFTDNVLDIIDAEIQEIDSVIQRRLGKSRGLRDLQNERERYRKLANNLDEVVRRLKESLCTDISGEKFEINFPRILNAINEE